MQRLSQVSLQLLVVGDTAGVVGWGDVLGHGVNALEVFTSSAVCDSKIARFGMVMLGGTVPPLSIFNSHGYGRFSENTISTLGNAIP